MAPVSVKRQKAKFPRPAARRSPRGHSNSDIKSVTIDPTNPLMIPEVTAHLMRFVDLESLAACRLTCTSWAAQGSREIVRRVNFKFTDIDLGNIQSFESLMKNVQKKSIRLSISMTQFAFCRRFEKLDNIFSKYGDRITHLNLEFTEKEDDIMLEFARLLWSTRYQIFMLKRILPYGPGDTEPITAKDLNWLSKLTNLNFEIEGGPPKQIMACQKYVENHIRTCVKKLISMTPNLTSMQAYWHHYDDVCCSQAVDVIADVVPDKLRHLKIQSPTLAWVYLAEILATSSTKMNLDTLCAETISRNFARIILSKEIGKSRVVATGPRYRAKESQACVRKLNSTISHHESAHSETITDGSGKKHTSVNCVRLFGDIALALSEDGQ